MSILVTGATGYIGSHTVVELLKNDYEVVGLDDFSNSSPEVLERIELLTNCQISFYEGDVKDKEVLKKSFKKNP
jgi:UDP-glucose 4-epimerase